MPITLNVLTLVVVLGVTVYLWIIGPIRMWRRGKRTDF